MPPPLAAVLPGGGRVLSIQSHTVSGYVGNKCAVFPLQLHGFDVDPINSVQFSNHTGYPTFKGDVLNGDQLWTLIEGLEENDLLQYTHLVTGYIGSLSFLDTVLRVIEKVRTSNPKLIYVCDPVMGDNGALYVKPELVPVYREKVVPQANILTPNQFEAEQLVQFSIASEKDAFRACEVLHSRGPQRVVITSVHLNGEILIIGSQAAHGKFKALQFRIVVPKLPHSFTGTGDLMTALILACANENPDDLARATELAVASLQAVIQRTIADYALAGIPSGTKRGQLELRLIQSKDDLIAPTVKLHAETIPSKVDS
ncbi:Pyridoxal/pyridoxine/pyridoxamine kinase [Klebsormidium nitens]|uniref:pyridoxal kinase n=1 Tax=Klebsormidium nitens TaxID=105231 RepID=A0A1Y1ILZ2_KLENI|nr:Pyridoxal/pyridoxine/pyridoxamine kinase [Klebsormidium nitens]|eukprot:GAQ89128.1 Pyridoxal/pyridoxine/pyridoxamine kinase [Klebsormidium nitens]